MDTDACQLAAGAYYRGDWLYHHFTIDSPECANLHINHKEVLAQVFAAFRWAPLWANRHVIIHCDNVAAVHIINKGTTNNSLVMFFLRQLFWLSAIYNFRFIVEYYCRCCLAPPSTRESAGLLQPPAPRSAPPPSPVHTSNQSHVLTQWFIPSLQAHRTQTWPRNLKRRSSNTASTPLLPPRRLRTTLIGPAIYGFAHVWVLPPFPTQSAHLCQYAAFLARSLKPPSIPNYLNIIGLLLKEFNLPNPLVDNWSLQSLLTGIKRVLPPKNYLLLQISSCVFSPCSTYIHVLMPRSGPFA